jgi:hypothetical protein
MQLFFDKRFKTLQYAKLLEQMSDRSQKHRLTAI